MKEPTSVPDDDDVKRALQDSCRVLLGDIGAGSISWNVNFMAQVSGNNFKELLVNISISSSYDKETLSRFYAALAMTKQICNDRVSVTVCGV